MGEYERSMMYRWSARGLTTGRAGMWYEWGTPAEGQGRVVDPVRLETIARMHLSGVVISWWPLLIQ